MEHEKLTRSRRVLHAAILTLTIMLAFGAPANAQAIRSILRQPASTACKSILVGSCVWGSRDEHFLGLG